MPRKKNRRKEIQAAKREREKRLEFGARKMASNAPGISFAAVALMLGGAPLLGSVLEERSDVSPSPPVKGEKP